MGYMLINVLGVMRIKQSGQDWLIAKSTKLWEVFAYLAVHPHRTLSRSTVAGSIWAEKPEDKALKSLRQALWQIQNDLLEPDIPVLDVTRTTVSLRQHESIQQDNVVFQQAFSQTQGIHGFDLNADQAQMLQDAASLYRDELLTGFDFEWCLFERQRLQDMAIVVLDKLMCYYCAHMNYETGIACGERILEIERLQERAHRMLIALHYLNGNRNRAVEQYHFCADLLQKELDVSPTHHTQTIFQHVLDETLQIDCLTNSPIRPALKPQKSQWLNQIEAQIQQIEQLMNDIQSHFRNNHDDIT